MRSSRERATDHVRLTTSLSMLAVALLLSEDRSSASCWGGTSAQETKAHGLS